MALTGHQSLTEIWRKWRRCYTVKDVLKFWVWFKHSAVVFDWVLEFQEFEKKKHTECSFLEIKSDWQNLVRFSDRMKNITEYLLLNNYVVAMPITSTENVYLAFALD